MRHRRDRFDHCDAERHLRNIIQLANWRAIEGGLSNSSRGRRGRGGTRRFYR